MSYHHSLKSLRVRELQMDWLRSEDLKEEKNVTTPIVIIASVVSEEAEVANAHEAARQQVQEESAQELFDRQSHEPFLVAVGGVAPAEGDVAVDKSNQPAVGNGDAMSVSTEIAQHVFWPAERPFGVDDPVVTEQNPQPRGEGARFCKR